jgi:hypothetical protein
VLVDVFSLDPNWADWSASAIRSAHQRGAVAVNPVVISELAPGFETHEQLTRTLSDAALVLLPLPWRAAFVAGKRSRSTCGVAAAGERHWRTSTLAPMPVWPI